LAPGLSCYHINDDAIPDVSIFRTFDTFVDHFADRLHRGSALGKEVDALDCILDKLSNMLPDNLTAVERGYRRRLVEEIELLSKGSAVERPSNKREWLSNRLSNTVAGNCFLSREDRQTVEKIFG
jgi:hypothetical protein